jgi:hypothetical protein
MGCSRLLFDLATGVTASALLSAFYRIHCRW